MDALTVAAAGGMRSRLESLEMLANNIANASTTGFKADREFYSLYSAAEADASSELPNIERRWTDFSQGEMNPTASPLDLALNGKGFFVVRGPSGTLYTRNGSFRLSNGGVLETQEHYPVLSADGKPIQLDSSQPADIDSDGIIQQDGQEVGRLAVVDWPDLTALSKHGDTYFSMDPTGLPAQPAAGVEIRQGVLEGANDPPAQAAVRLVSVLRQFEMLQRAMSLGTDMNRRAVEEVAKV